MIKRWIPKSAFYTENNDNVVLVRGHDGHYIPYVNAEAIYNGLNVRLDAQQPLAQQIMDLKVQLAEAIARGETA